MKRSWANFDPKMAASWHQVGFKIEPKRPSKSNWPTIAKTLKSAVLALKSRVRGAKIEAKLAQKSIKNVSKKQSKTRANLDGILEGSWGQLSSKMAPSWGASWGQVGSQIDKNGVQDDIQKRSRNKEG